MAFGRSHRDPYANSLGQLIEKATFAGMQTEDWGQFMHICDIINTTHDGPKDAVKALKKRISKNYNHKEIQLTLSVMRAQLLSRVQLFAAPWTVAHQAPLSMEFSRQEYWTGLPFPPLG
uniref:Target of myb1 like 1 membrane trafficking protein n=1 Tax=Ovis aries TaxID=9940 RepID=A0AC11DBT5_SHEEP